MDKLEERLRTRRRFIYVGDLKYVQNFEPDADCHEAADEITRLKGEVDGMFCQLSATFDEKETLRLALAEIVPGNLCGESYDPPVADAEYLQISATWEWLRRARALLARSSGKAGSDA